MASIATSHDSFPPNSFQPFEYDTGVKVLADSSNLKAVPSKFNYTNEPTGLTSDSLPVVDFSALTTADPDQRSRALLGLAKACQEWGFFILVNHGIPEELMKAVCSSTREFFNLAEGEKKQYEAKSASDPIKCGNFNVSTTSNQTFTLWRDYLKLYVHPQFHCPSKPQVLRNDLLQYTEKTRKLARELVEAVSETLELEKHYVDEALKLDSSFQMFAANFYPPCPEPDQAIGIPPHTDHGLFTFLIHNGVAGLQIEHDGMWFNVESPQNSILVNVADQLQIFSNGRLKSVKHRAVVNSERERISLVVANGPSGDAVVGPAASLVEKDGRALYRPMEYMEYVDSQLTKSRVGGKPILEQIMIHDYED
ncbi:probable 2-oxoglutarate/fe(ii)-dependent dioxygenase [Phtheirospermum japonicum]|uniref:Probable 2-oxoglutarate/fe(Ii)-dependent dioxygenase n=1 Tax=Phtheirospermum japonicum TaxID=374723 RepID=A0A830BHF0_9LAMI|nr:probable 2-oxoglutarate/fe(ii)-dependent dioxygenase [Phtheirospermum japonicum]